MRQNNFAAALLVTAMLAGCGGGGGAGDQSPRIRFTSQVTFGDSLSDVGSYAVPAITASGGGQFTVNGTGKNWTELMAAQLGQTAPCAAVTGGYGTAATTHAGCYGYAQGGARVTAAAGIGNDGTIAGALTYPVATQIANHLAAVGSFSGDEIVFVEAGANDVLTQAGTYPVLLGAPYNLSPADALATVSGAVTLAATELATQITDQLIANGARHVVVVNIPDISNTPYAASVEAVSAGSKVLFDTLVTTFNAELRTRLANNANVVLVDAYSVNRDQITNPAIYGLTNVTNVGCSTPSSLVCSSATLNAGFDSHYLFADGVHPTPYGYLLLARLVSKEMLVKGWL